MPPLTQHETSRAAADPLPSVLVVEDEPLTRRYLQAALERTGKYVVHAAGDVPAAVELLHDQAVNLVLSDIDLPGHDGFSLLRRVRQEPRLWDLPFFFLSGHTSHATKIRAYNHGLDAFLEKPIVLPEVLARIDGVLSRIERTAARKMVRSYELAGSFSGLTFPDLVTILENGQRTGKISILAMRSSGLVYVHKGRIRHATFGNLEGSEAFYRIFEHEEGQFEFCPGELDFEEVPQSIGLPATALMLEAARRLDTRRRDAKGSSEEADTPEGVVEEVDLETAFDREGEKTTATKVSPVRLAAHRIAKVIADPFERGELQYLVHEDLTWLAEAEDHGEQVLVWLLADRVEALRALGSLAGPLAEPQIVKGLQDTPKVLSLTFDVQSGRTVHVLAIDQETPLVFEDFESHGGIVIVAPAGGSWESFPVAAQVAYRTLLRKHAPELVVPLGDFSVAEAARQATKEEGVIAQVRPSGSGLGESRTRFRELLSEALFTWARTGPRRVNRAA